jgi:hypothetical protein
LFTRNYEEKTEMTDITTHGKAKIDDTGEHSQSNEEVMVPSADFEDEAQANGTSTHSSTHSQQEEDFMMILPSNHLDLGILSTTDPSSIDLVSYQSLTSEMTDYSSVDFSVKDELKAKSSIWAHSKGEEFMVTSKIDTAERADAQQAPAQYDMPASSKRSFIQIDTQKIKDSWKQAKETEGSTLSLQSYLEQTSVTLDISSRYFAAEDLPQAQPAQTSSVSCSDRLSYRTRSAVKELMRFRALKLAQALLAVYVGVLTYADMGPPGGLRDGETGLIVDQESPERTARGLILLNGTERAIVGATQFQVVCIGITRMSAFFMYPGKKNPNQRYQR